MGEARTVANGRAVHGGVLLAALGIPFLVPACRLWPWVWLVPLAAYLALAGLIAPLRRSFGWLRPGRCDLVSGIGALAIVILSCSVLILFQVIVRPDVRSLGAALSVQGLGRVVLAGLWFAVLNATLEEAVFRGVLLDALEAQWGAPLAVVLTAALFGLMHLRGYPPGPIGALLAGSYGVMLGWLRVRTAGLMVPILVHVTADATIYCILVYTGAVGSDCV